MGHELLTPFIWKCLLFHFIVFAALERKKQIYFSTLYIFLKSSIYNVKENRISFPFADYLGIVFNGFPKFILKEKGKLYLEIGGKENLIE